MNAPGPALAPIDEGRAIAELIAARLDVAMGETDPLAVAAAEAALAGRPGGARFEKLLALFGCGLADRALLLTALAPEIDPTLAARYETASGRPWATEWLAAELFGLSGQALARAGGMARRWRLIELRDQRAGEPPAIAADGALRAWIDGHMEIEGDLEGAISLAPPHRALSAWPVASTAERVARAAERQHPSVLFVVGAKGTGRATFCAQVAQRLGQRCLVVDRAALDRAWRRDDTARAHRAALVAGAALVWRDPPAGALELPGLRSPALQAVALEPDASPPDPGALAPHVIALPALEPPARRKLVEASVEGAAAWPEAALDALSTRRALTPAAIARLGRVAPPSAEAALEAANDLAAAAMGGLARRMSGDLFWDDLVLPEALARSLRDFAHETSLRAELWRAPEARRLFGREASAIALFHGPPGGGKTMAAQVLARALGLDLYRIDCASVVSKYIGETAKNLRAIFARAASIDAVLFFDEADTLFSRRTEVKDSHDRHANADTAYLLQLIEGAFDGVAILATNRLGDMDPAFMRRIPYAFEFPRPEASERAAIWARAAAALGVARAKERDALWRALGAALDVTGAQIKTILLAAHFAAARAGSPMEAEHLLDAAMREYRKEGRVINSRDVERIRAHA